MTFVGFRDRALNPFSREGVFPAHKDKCDVCLDGESGNDHAFDELVGVSLQQQTVFESAGLHLVGVGYQVCRVRDVFAQRYERPFQTGLKTSASPAAEIGVFHFVSNRFRFHAATQNLADRLVTAALLV